METGRGSFENATNSEDQASEDNGQSATNEISQVTGDDSTEEGTSREDGCNERLVGGLDAEMIMLVGDNFGISGSETREDDIGIFGASVLLDEVVHTKDTSHPAGIITKEDTTKGSKGNNQVGPDGNGCLNTVDIGSARNGNDSTSRHGCGIEVVSRLKKRAQQGIRGSSMV